MDLIILSIKLLTKQIINRITIIGTTSKLKFQESESREKKRCELKEKANESRAKNKDLASRKKGKEEVHTRILSNQIVYAEYSSGRRRCKDPQWGVHPFLTLIDSGETTDASQTRLPPPSAVSPLSIP